MDKHTQECIRFFEIMAKAYENDAEACRRLDVETNYMDSYNFNEILKNNAVARAYRTCIEALANPAYFRSTTEG